MDMLGASRMDMGRGDGSGPDVGRGVRELDPAVQLECPARAAAAALNAGFPVLAGAARERLGCRQQDVRQQQQVVPEFDQYGSV